MNLLSCGEADAVDMTMRNPDGVSRDPVECMKIG
jgi:hypothetical protein